MSTDPSGFGGDGPGGILIALEVLIVADSIAPRAHEHATEALERLASIGRPVVLAGPRIAGRRLPSGQAALAAWARNALGRPGLAVVSLGVQAGSRGDGAAQLTVEAWRALRARWRSRWVLLDRDAGVGPARQAGLLVLGIGPREPHAEPRVERPDYEARDLLDAAGHLLAMDAFAASGVPG